MDLKYIKEKLKGMQTVERSNLALLLGDNRRTVDYRIKILQKNDIITPLKNGFYYINQNYENSVNKEFLNIYFANLIQPNSYISLEYALAYYNLIPEKIVSYTFVTTTKTKQLNTPLGFFRYRKIKPELYFGYKQIFYEGFFYNLAEPYKAVFDFLYFLPYYKDFYKNNLQENLRINWYALPELERIKLYDLIDKTKSKKLQKYKKIIQNIYVKG